MAMRRARNVKLMVLLLTTAAIAAAQTGSYSDTTTYQLGIPSSPFGITVGSDAALMVYRILQQQDRTDHYQRSGYGIPSSRHRRFGGRLPRDQTVPFRFTESSGRTPTASRPMEFVKRVPDTDARQQSMGHHHGRT